MFRTLRSVLFFALLFLTISNIATAKPLFKTESIFPLGDKHAHSSSLVECPDGSLLACWFYGSGERTAEDVVVQGSRLQKGSSAWSPVFLMADTPGFPDCNPVLFIDRQERLWMFWITVLAERWECSQLKYRLANDPSGSEAPEWDWQDVLQLKPGDEFSQVMADRFKELQLPEGAWAEYALPYVEMLLQASKDPYKRQTGWMTRTNLLTLPSGRILLPLYSDGFNASLMAISDDDGKTWRASTPIIGLGPIQPAVARGRDGRLVAFCRDSGDLPGRVMVASSEDDGETWSTAVDCDIPNSGASLAVISLADGRWLMVCNDLEEGRHRLTALLSDDEGKTWNVRRQLAPSDSQGKKFDYPSIIQTRDGLVHLTYSYTTATGRCIRHCVLNTEWIEGK